MDLLSLGELVRRDRAVLRTRVQERSPQGRIADGLEPV